MLLQSLQCYCQSTSPLGISYIPVIACYVITASMCITVCEDLVCYAMQRFLIVDVKCKLMLSPLGAEFA